MSADPDLEKTAAVAGPSLITVQDYPPTISKRPWEEFMAQDEIEAKKLKPEEAEQEHSTSNRKIYIGNLPPSVTEKPLVAHFRTFGHVINCSVVRDKEHGISRGFAFLTFLDDAEAAAAAAFENHKLDGNSIRVSFAHAPGSGGNVIKTGKKNFHESNWVDTVTLPRNQTRIYVGPLDNDVNNSDLTTQLSTYGPIQGVSRLKATDTAVKRSFGFIEFRDSISVKRAFANKIFIKGKHVRVTLSKLAMELILSKTVAFFYEAHEYCDKRKLEQHFNQFGQVFRAFQMMDEEFNSHKNYGFVDFIGADSVPKSTLDKQQLIPPGQYVRLARFLPPNYLYDLMAISDRHANLILKKLEQSVPDQGVWGAQGFKSENEETSSQVRIPSKMVSRLIGERGKTITEICRDSKTKITIPRVHDDEPNVVLTIIGTKVNIKTAQYLMQKLLKGQNK